MNWYRVVLLLVTFVCICAPMLYVFSIKEKEMHPNVKEIHDTQALRIENANLRLENAKLRQLATALEDCRHTTCDDCVRWDYPNGGCYLDDVMRELGIEVGE